MPLASGAQSDWSIINSPNSLPTAWRDNNLQAVTCVSASDCWAVGYYRVDVDSASNFTQTLIEHWDGTAWAIASSPNVLVPEEGGSVGNLLSGVTCASASDCWAVGYYYNGSTIAMQTLIEHWDGTAWAIVSSPNSSANADHFLNGVTCASASECWSVGYYYLAGSNYQTLIERWDGTSWTIVSSPNTGPTQANYLYGVTCASTSECWTVGNYFDGNTTLGQTLIERWDGTAWTIVSSPNTSDSVHDDLFSVTCASASECWAVGYANNGSIYQTLIERWDGTSWTIVTSPNIGTVSLLYGVTCRSASDCWAVGYYPYDIYNGNSNQTLIEHWDGTSWGLANSANPSATQSNELSAVTCVSAAADCWAIGFYNNTNSFAQTLTERWDGTSWAVITSPNTAASSPNIVSGVTCVSASDCWAVGYYSVGSFLYQTLIERWDGTSWAVVTSPNTSTMQLNVLLGVTCASASDCWAVGYYLDASGTTYQTLIERWDGTAWAIVTSPNTSATQTNALSGVTCTSASDCWAVGSYYNGTADQTLIERWDGTSWTIVTSPNIGSPVPNTAASVPNILAGVTCASTSECWAVGYYHVSVNGIGTVYQTLIERWDGSAWTIVISLSTSTAQYNLLAGVTCASTSDCWAVGTYYNGSADQTLIEHWDGTAWTVVSSPNPSVQTFLNGVTCASASECWAVGYYYNYSTTAYQTLIERWDGTAWAIDSSANTDPSQNNVLYGVTCASASECWAVGSTGQTLVLSYR